jgi:nucleotide-binding universal stress UspA family protein
VLRMLLPIDGSENSLRAVDYLLRTAGWYRETIEVHLLNVQHPLPGDVSMFVRGDQIKQYHQEEGAKALAPARAKLDAAKITYVSQVSVGDPADVIASYAKEKRCDQICIGTRGLGHIAGMLLGSVATKVIHLSNVPVLLVK